MKTSEELYHRASLRGVLRQSSKGAKMQSDFTAERQRNRGAEGDLRQDGRNLTGKYYLFCRRISGNNLLKITYRMVQINEFVQNCALIAITHHEVCHVYCTYA
jgi:hypothetical protein